MKLEPSQLLLARGGETMSPNDLFDAAAGALLRLADYPSPARRRDAEVAVAAIEAALSARTRNRHLLALIERIETLERRLLALETRQMARRRRQART
jgi:hypothetical protein